MNETLVDVLARALHEAGRSAVEHGLVLNKIPGQPFYEWDELTDEARAGRRVQAAYLIEEGWVTAQPA